MTRRFEAGPVLVIVGAVVLIVSLFLDWFEPGVTAWTVFEALDLVLVALGLAALVAALGLVLPENAVLDRRWLPPLVVAVIVVVASQIIDSPPAVSGGDAEGGAWLALGAAAAMLLGVVLTFSRVHLAVTVEGRDVRRRVAAVDAREEEPEPSEEVAPAPEEKPEPDPLATQPMPPTARPDRPDRPPAPWERLGGLGAPTPAETPAEAEADKDDPGRGGA